MKISGKEYCMACMHPLDQNGECGHCHFKQNSYVPQADWLPVGTLLNGRYLLGKVLGQGGFGITYIGWDMILATPVAIKAGHEKSGQNFLKETRMLSRFAGLDGIIAARDFFEDEQTSYIVMDFVDGASVKTFVCENGPMDAVNALNRIRPIIASLAQIHREGLIHRDISGDNLMITRTGKFQLIDFGTARPAQAVDRTKSITVSFKRGFSPEEQYRTKGEQGPWTDVYSICATLYYLITGIRPEESVQRLVADTVKPLASMSRVALSLATKHALDKGMSVMARNRQQTMEELYQNLYHEAPWEDAISLDLQEQKNQGNPGQSEKAVMSHTALRREVNEMMGMRQQENKQKKNTAKRKKIVLACATVVLVGALVAAGFALGKRTSSLEKNNHNIVMATAPATPTPTKKATLKQITMPKVTGKTIGKVEKLLGSRHIKFSIKKKYSKKVKKGKVISQGVKAGKSVKKSTKVKLVVSKGSATAPTTAPRRETTPTIKTPAPSAPTKKPSSSKSGSKDTSGKIAGSIDDVIK